MRTAVPVLAAALLAAAAPARAQDAGEPMDYDLLTHTVAIESLRAGNHDASGVNDYYFSVAMYALSNSAEERNLEFDKRKKLEVDLGTFGDLKIDALSTWRPDEKAQDVKELKVEGNAVRELTARAMTDLGLAESGVAVMVRVTMWEREKRFLFLGEDRRIAALDYHPIPPTKFELTSPFRTNVVLPLSDDKGTLVKIAVRYDKPQATPKAAAKTAPAEEAKASR